MLRLLPPPPRKSSEDTSDCAERRSSRSLPIDAASVPSSSTILPRSSSFSRASSAFFCLSLSSSSEDGVAGRFPGPSMRMLLSDARRDSSRSNSLALNWYSPTFSANALLSASSSSILLACVDAASSSLACWRSLLSSSISACCSAVTSLSRISWSSLSWYDALEWQDWTEGLLPARLARTNSPGGGPRFAASDRADPSSRLGMSSSGG
mmetsp:Transcript_14301/g.31350  ORF Transcript_14301/g.31350 Transcript_14301/m.31350 type:complete len:209 (+) Transcript_14301:2130-2756(+)